MPLEQVFPVFVEQLPLKADFQEHKAVFKSILTLYQAGVTLLQSYIHTLLKVAVIILHEEKTVDVGKYLINSNKYFKDTEKN